MARVKLLRRENYAHFVLVRFALCMQYVRVASVAVYTEQLRCERALLHWKSYHAVTNHIITFPSALISHLNGKKQAWGAGGPA